MHNGRIGYSKIFFKFLFWGLKILFRLYQAQKCLLQVYMSTKKFLFSHLKKYDFTKILQILTISWFLQYQRQSIYLSQTEFVLSCCENISRKLCFTSVLTTETVVTCCERFCRKASCVLPQKRSLIIILLLFWDKAHLPYDRFSSKHLQQFLS